MHRIIGHAIHRIVRKAIAKTAKSAAISVYENKFGENSRNRSFASPEDTYDFTKPKDIKRLFQTVKTSWDELSEETETKRVNEYKQELLWYTSLTPIQQRIIDVSYRDGSYKFKKRNPKNIPLSPAQKRNIIDPQPIPFRFQAIKFVRDVTLILLLLLISLLLFSIFDRQLLFSIFYRQ